MKKYVFNNEDFYTLIRKTELIKQEGLSKKAINYRETSRVYLVLYWKKDVGFGKKTFKSPMGIAIDKNHIHTEADDLYAAAAYIDYSVKYDDEYSITILHNYEHMYNKEHPEQYNRLFQIINKYHDYTINFNKVREIPTLVVEYAEFDYYDIYHTGIIHAVISDKEAIYTPNKIMYSNKYFKNRHANAEYNRIRAAKPPKRKVSFIKRLIQIIQGPDME